MNGPDSFDGGPARHPDDTAEREREALAAAVREAAAAGSAGTLRAIVEDHHAADVAEGLAALPAEEALRGLRLLDTDDRGLIFGYLPQGCQVKLSRSMRRRELADVITAMSHDERADLFKSLDEDARDDLLPALAQAEREDLRRLAAYPEGKVGAIMTSDYAVLAPEMTAAEALDALRLQAPDSETVYQAYIVDADRRLVGTVSLRDVLVARSFDRIRDIMETRPVKVAADAPRDEAAQRIAQYDLMALPVVDAEDRLVGIVTQDDAMDVQAEEATEDFHRVGTVQRLGVGVRDATIWMLYRARAVWLLVLVFGNLFSGAGIAFFEDTIAAYVMLVFFLPLLIGSGGNAGSQSATLMVRALATGDVRFSDWGYMLGREVLVAALLGLSMAAAVSLIGLARGGPEVAVVVALSMIAIVVVGSLVGMSLPFLLARFRLDPATASAPLVTSIADAAGVLIYFTIATTILPAAGLS